MNRETKKINSENVIELVDLVKTDEQLLVVQKYLRDNNLTIDITECYDAQSGWTGRDIYLEGVNLSVNGYCYKVSNLLNHIENHRKYLKVKDTDEYKLYLKLKTKYQHLNQL